MSLYEYANRDAIAFNMSKGNRGMQDLLKRLSNKELTILRKHPDLCHRVLQITKMGNFELMEALKKEFNLDIQFFHNDDVWISTENVEDAIPEWFNSQHYGWFRSQRAGEFSKWAMEFLLQEVRVNIWLRYLEHKKNNPHNWRDMTAYAGYL